MPLTVEDRTIERILIIDDDPGAREGYEYPLEELGVMPVLETGPINDISLFLDELPKRADAVLCDYHLKKHDYARFDGDYLTAACFKAKIPGLLCTTFSDFEITVNRGCLRFIPAVLMTNSPAPDDIASSLKICMAEMSGEYDPLRKPWRQLVRIVEVDSEGKYFYAVVPGWDPSTKIRLYTDNLPPAIQPLVEPGKRLHAKVNIGAGGFQCLYFDEWEAQ